MKIQRGECKINILEKKLNEPVPESVVNGSKKFLEALDKTIKIGFVALYVAFGLRVGESLMADSEYMKTGEKTPIAYNLPDSHYQSRLTVEE
jgi:hypothetical protein